MYDQINRENIMPSKDKNVLNRAAKKHWDKIKDDPEVKRKARERAKAWYEANKQRAKEWAEANKEKRKEQLKKWKEENPERVRELRRQSQARNPESTRKRLNRYLSSEKGKITAAVHRDAYRARVKQQSLGMYDRKAINLVYRTCKMMTKTTGEKYEVDHIVPIKCDMVCGLHVSWNLRIITKAENRQKTNRLID